MTTVAVYSCVSEESAYFETFAVRFGLELRITRDAPSIKSAEMARGCECISILSGTNLTPELLDAFYSRGVRFISTRTIGYEHIDLAHAAKIGMAVACVTYSAASVADYAVMMMLMAIRKVKTMMSRAAAQDFTSSGLCGKELHNMTVGILGVGHIGAAVAQNLSGFGCRILGCSLHENEQSRQYLTYVDMPALYRDSDIITLHLRADASTYHIIDAAAIAQMKPDAILVNTARGQLVDTPALIDALEQGRLGGAALDVVEGDRSIYYRNRRGQVIRNRDMAILNAMPNVLMLPHMAYFTDQAVSDMVCNSLDGCSRFSRGERPDGLVIPALQR